MSPTTFPRLTIPAAFVVALLFAACGEEVTHAPIAAGAGAGGAAETSSVTANAAVGSGGAGGQGGDVAPSCPEPEPTVMVDGTLQVNHFSQVIAAGEFVYMADQVLGEIVRVPRCDKAAAILWSGEAPREFDVVGSQIFWLAGQLGLEDEVATVRAGTPGGAPLDLYTSAAGETLLDLAADDAHVYFVADDGSSARLLRVPHSGGAIDELATLPTSGAARVALSPSFVYVNNGGSVTRAPKGGGPPAAFATMTSGLHTAIDVSDGVVYWADGSDLFREPEAGGPAVLIASLPEPPDYLVVDSGYVYYSSLLGSVYGRVEASGGKAPEVLFEGANMGTQNFALDEQAIYWVDIETSSLKRMAKPKGAL